MKLYLSEIESLLFVAGAPLTRTKIAKQLHIEKSEVDNALAVLLERYNAEDSGIHIVAEGEEVYMVTNPKNAEYVKKYVKSEFEGELTKAQLETFTVIAYQGPVTRAELEEIRGVNCALILRNLLMRGLIKEEENGNVLVPIFSITAEALAHLGCETLEKLPDYATMHDHAYVQALFAKREEKK